MRKLTRSYTVSDGKIVLVLREAEEGGYVVTSPLCPGLVTEAGTVEEAFENARDAIKALSDARRNRARHVRAELGSHQLRSRSA